MSAASLNPPANVTGIQYQNSDIPSSGKTIDEICCGFLDDLFPRAGGAIWKASIIFKLKDIFESQHYHFTIYGPRHPSTLSTPTLVCTTRHLIMGEFFNHYSPNTHFDLELHLRCVVAALRLLSVHGIQPGTGMLTFESFNDLYNRMSWWENYHLQQIQALKEKSEQTKNYNNEFLILYARDMISSMPSDRTLAANVATRMMSAAAMFGHAYGKNVVLAAQSLKTVVQAKYSPTSWHMKYRTIDDLCLSIRTFRQCSSYQSPKVSGKSWMNDVPEISNALETAEDCVVNELIATLEIELENGLAKEGVRSALRATGDAVGTVPLARLNHFFYGVLDLIQQHVHTLNSRKMDDKIVKLSVKVAEKSPHSYLRCKAFEILAGMIPIPDIGQMPVNMVNQLLENSKWSEKVSQKFSNQWYVMRKRAVDVERFLIDLRAQSLQLNLMNNIPPPSPTNRAVKNISTLLNDLEGTLVCPFSTEEEPDLSMLSCGHLASLGAWRTYESMSHGRNLLCPVCQLPVEDISKPLPMGKIGDIVRRIREECRGLNDLFHWNQEIIRINRQEMMRMNLPEQVVQSSRNSEPEVSVRVPFNQNSSQSYPPNLTTSSTQESTGFPESVRDNTNDNWDANLVFGTSSIWENEVRERDSRRDLDTLQSGLSEGSPGNLYTTHTMGADSTYLSKHDVEPDGSHASSDVDRDPLQNPLFSSFEFFPGIGSLREDNTSAYTPSMETLHNISQTSTYAPTESITRPPFTDPAASHSSQTNYFANLNNPTAPLDPITEELPNRRYSKSKGDTRSKNTDTESVNIRPADSILLNTEAGKGVEIPESVPLSLEQSVRRQSTSSGSIGQPSSIYENLSRNNQSDTTSMRSEKIVPSPEVKGFRVERIAKVQLGPRTTVQSTAISSTCETIALIKDSNFQIYSVPRPGSSGRIALKSCGFNDGRFGFSLSTARKPVDEPLDRSPVYASAAISDTILCIACIGNCVDIHETSTGRRIRILSFPGLHCRTLTISPNGNLLAVGMETGEILIYDISIEGNLSTEPVSIESSDASRPVNCIAFSPDSTLMSYCSSKNVIYTYSLDDAHEIASYNRNLDERACREPYYGVTSLAYSFDSSSLLIIADAEHASPVIIKNITSPKEHVITLSEKEYKFKNCRTAYSRLNNTALLITRFGKIKLANLNTGSNWRVIELEEGLDSSGRHWWRFCSLEFSRDGRRALALDRRGKLLVIDFTYSGSDANII